MVKGAMASNSIVAVVGEINMDLVFEKERSPERNESLGAFSLSYHPSGRGAKTATALYRASHTKPVEYSNEESTTANGYDIPVFMNGAVGDEHFGTQLKAKLKMQNIDISGVQTVKANSGICTVIVETFTRESWNLGYPGAALKWDA
ncbi:MAG: hypothetical protein Q9214_002684 [Letrouitia sp. 1 TL-2023]